LYNQDRFSKLVVVDDKNRGEEKEVIVYPGTIKQESYETPETLVEESKGRSLGRLAAFKFAIKNSPDVSKGGYLIGGGIGSSLDSFIPSANGKIYDAYPEFELAKTPLTMIFLELGLLGLLSFAWFFYLLGKQSLNLLNPDSAELRSRGILGISLCISLLSAFVYTNILLSESYMIVLAVISAMLFSGIELNSNE
jgi:hypothetical protein